MKIGVIDDKWKPPKDFKLPQSGEWWLVFIVHETSLGSNRGCLIMRPISKIDINSANFLLPGFYDSWQPNPGTLIVTPKYNENGHWHLPLTLKNDLMNKLGLALIVVKLGGEYWKNDKSEKKENNPDQSGLGSGDSGHNPHNSQGIWERHDS